MSHILNLHNFVGFLYGVGTSGAESYSLFVHTADSFLVYLTYFYANCYNVTPVGSHMFVSTRTRMIGRPASFSMIHTRQPNN